MEEKKEKERESKEENKEALDDSYFLELIRAVLMALTASNINS